MTQTSYVAIMEAPSGHRLVLQAGTHKYTEKTEKVPLTSKFVSLVSGIASPGQQIAGVASPARRSMLMAYLPYFSSTMYTMQVARSITLSRKTGSMSGLFFSYLMVGH